MCHSCVIWSIHWTPFGGSRDCPIKVAEVENSLMVMSSARPYMLEYQFANSKKKLILGIVFVAKKNTIIKKGGGPRLKRIIALLNGGRIHLFSSCGQRRA